MMLKAGISASLAIMAATSSAAAECRYMSLRFHVAQNDSASTTGVSRNGSACTTRFWTSGTSHFTSGSIIARPKHGTLSGIGSLRFRYKPQAGFKGADQYTLRVCGTSRAGSGCSTLTYNITVQ